MNCGCLCKFICLWRYEKRQDLNILTSLWIFYDEGQYDNMTSEIGHFKVDRKEVSTEENS